MEIVCEMNYFGANVTKMWRYRVQNEENLNKVSRVLMYMNIFCDLVYIKICHIDKMIVSGMIFVSLFID